MRANANRQILTGVMPDEDLTISRFKVEGTDARAFLEAMNDPKWASTVTHGSRPSAAGRHRPNFPSSCCWATGLYRSSSSAAQEHRDGRRFAPESRAKDALRSLEQRDLRRVEDHLRRSGNLEHGAGLKVGKAKSGAASDQNIVEGAEVQIACEIRNCQRSVGVGPNKAGLASPVRDVDLATVATVDIGCGEECVGGCDQRAVAVVERLGFVTRRSRARARSSRKSDRKCSVNLGVRYCVALNFNELNKHFAAVRGKKVDDCRPCASNPRAGPPPTAFFRQTDLRGKPSSQAIEGTASTAGQSQKSSNKIDRNPLAREAGSS